ncbi:MAG: mevalonate kinase [Gammaproteobacteria bacterium]
MKIAAPAKLILSGEYSAVFGCPAIACAIDRYVTITTNKTASEDIQFDFPDLNILETASFDSLKELKTRLLERYALFREKKISAHEILNSPSEFVKFAFIRGLDALKATPKGTKFTYHSDIPIGCGLGSSAAIAVGTLLATSHLYGKSLSDETFLTLAQEVENLQHGYSSGIDIHISYHGGSIEYQSMKIKKLTLPNLSFHLIHTGKPKSTTGECVAQVKEHFQNTNIWEDFSDVTHHFLNALLAKQSTIEMMRLNSRLLETIGVVPEKVKAFIRAVEKRGGAAKISGAGSIRGDAAGMLIVSDNIDIYDLCQEFGYSFFDLKGAAHGARIL